MFEKITKAFSVSEQNNQLYYRMSPECADHVVSDEEAHENALFMTYCFSLQQKYDIGCLESIIDGLDLISGIHSESVSSQLARQLLNKIKKQ